MRMFVTSDIHGYFNEFKKALDEAGFDENNKEHFLLTLGDHFDRGRQPEQVMKYLMSLKRWIGIKGNHESLLENCINRGYPYSHDWHNGTAQTIIDLAPNAQTFDVACSVAYEKTRDFLNRLVNYVESREYIFVHSFVPLVNKDKLPAHSLKNRQFEKMENWREASQKEWNEAMWGNPYELAEQGFLPNKTLVFGHFHTSYPRHKYENKQEFGEEADFSPYYGERYIGIDACTIYSKKCNVIVLEDDFLEE